MRRTGAVPAWHGQRRSHARPRCVSSACGSQVGVKPMTQALMAMRIAHRALRRNTLRSTLTMLGVIIGVAAVIAMLAIGQGAQAAIRAQIASLGAHSLIVQPGSVTQGG